MAGGQAMATSEPLFGYRVAGHRPLSSFAAASRASFTAAMNNLGIASDGAASFAGHFDLSNTSTRRNLSLQAMQAAGITPGTATAPGATFSLIGANFTMPQAQRERDHGARRQVIPDGQTILLPALPGE